MTTDIKPEMLSGVQTGNGTPHDKYDICGIAHEHTNRKDDIFMQVQNCTDIMEWGQGTCTLTKRTRRWTYSALSHFFCLYSVLIDRNRIFKIQIWVLWTGTGILKGHSGFLSTRTGILAKFRDFGS